MPATDREQYLLELINSARLDPVGSLARYITSFSPLASSVPSVQRALDLWHVNGTALLADLSAREAVSPLFFDDRLADAARAHNDAMIAANAQSHQLPGEPSLGERINNAKWSGLGPVGENILAQASDVIEIQAALMIDWGPGPDGMLSPAVDRANILNPNFRAVGIAITSTAPQSNVGPLVTTQDFGGLNSFGGRANPTFVLGVAYNDSDGDGYYSIGEGLGGLTVTRDGTVETVTAASGGYSLRTGGNSFFNGFIPMRPDDFLPLTFTGAGLVGPVTLTTTNSYNASYKIDFINGDTIRTSHSIDISGPIKNVEALVGGLTLRSGEGDQTFKGTRFDETFDGGVGNDSVRFSGQRAAYSISYAGHGVTDVTGPDGTDHLINIQRLIFADQVVSFNDAPPAITSTGGGDTASISAAENTRIVTTVTASDPDRPDDPLVSFSITGGADAALFAIDSATGLLTFIDPPDFETPEDANRDNAYIVRIAAADGDGHLDTQTITVNVADANDPPQEIIGSAGPDFLPGSPGVDTISGGDSNDTILGDAGNDVIFAGPGNDLISTGPGNDVATGDDGNDQLGGDAGNDRMNGGAGSDTLFGGSGNDELGGGAGDDTIVGNEGNDLIFGEDGADQANGGAGNDIMLGGIGNDTFGGGVGNDILVGGDGDDLLFGEAGVDNINGELGNDGVVGGSENDLLGGGPGNDIVVGDDGDDVLFGEIGNDRMNGGFGNDILLGSDGDDELGGGAGNDDLNGGFGNDTLFGESGDDILNGSAGNDVLIGMSGNDVFAIAAGDGTDIIQDFAAAGTDDRIWFIGTSLHTFADVLAAATYFPQFGATRIDYGTGTVTLNSVNASQLTANDFIFT